MEYMLLDISGDDITILILNFCILLAKRYMYIKKKKKK